MKLKIKLEDRMQNKRFIFFLFILFSSISFAQANPDVNYKKTQIGLRAEYYMPSDSDLDDIYGAGPVFGGEILFRMSASVSIGFQGGYYAKSGKPLVLTGISGINVTSNSVYSDIKIIPVVFNGYYHFPSQSSLKPYIGAGIGYYMLKEDMEGSLFYSYRDYYGYYHYDSIDFDEHADEAGSGISLFFGIQTGILFVELKYTSVNIDTEGLVDNYGGIHICGGLRF